MTNEQEPIIVAVAVLIPILSHIPFSSDDLRDQFEMIGLLRSNIVLLNEHNLNDAKPAAWHDDSTVHVQPQAWF